MAGGTDWTLRVDVPLVMASSDHETDATAAPPEGPPLRPGASGRAKTVEEIRDVYADQIDMLARTDRLNRLFTGRYRRRAFARATGRVLDVACGMATNARYVPPSAEYVGIDVSPDMLREARAELDRIGRDGEVREMDAQDLDFPDDGFDAVISSLSTCTFPDPVAALNEMGRVCDPDGHVLLLEHGRSDVDLVARFQDWRADAHFEKHACRWNQEPIAVVAESDLQVERAWSAALGIITGIEARPG